MLRDLQGRPVSRIELANLYTWQADGKTYRGAFTQTLIGGQGYRIVTVMDMNFHIHFLDNFRHSLWLIMILAGLVTRLAAWWDMRHYVA